MQAAGSKGNFTWMYGRQVLVSVGDCARFPFELAKVTFGLDTGCDIFIQYHCQRGEEQVANVSGGGYE